MLIEEPTLDGMPDALNYGGPLPDDVSKLVSKFLEKPIERDGDRPEIPDEDWQMLHEVFHQIIEAKFQRDSDGDQVATFELCNRQKCHMHAIRTPHTTKTDSDMEQAVNAIEHAASTIEKLSRQISFTTAYRRRNNARQKKMGVVIDFLASNGHSRALNRVVKYVRGAEGGELLIGKNDAVWASLGLTTAELHAICNNNGGRTIEVLDETLINAANHMMANL